MNVSLTLLYLIAIIKHGTAFEELDKSCLALAASVAKMSHSNVCL